MMNKQIFDLVTKYQPTGDQPEAINQLSKGLEDKKRFQVLLGVTGSGKTFTIANVIAQANRPVLVLSHNKTLASQLYSELKEFFPNNHVEYFVSYFDYYRPEAYMPRTDTYIDKTSKTNWDLEAMKMSTLNSMSVYRDTIVVASVASIYGALRPKEYWDAFWDINIGMKISRKDFLTNLVRRRYSRNNIANEPGTFNVKGDVIEITPSWTSDYILRIEMFGDEIENISKVNSLTKKVIEKCEVFKLFPATAYSLKDNTMAKAIETIKLELKDRLKYFEQKTLLLEKQRLGDRVTNDIDNMQEFGFCSGIENYSRHIDGRQEGEKPYTLFDYLPDDTLLIIDESHMMIPQLHAMYNGDRARKSNLVEYGFRLPSALDNRPLKFEEFEDLKFQTIYISATPSEYELEQVDNKVVRQLIRPTGLLDPEIEIRSPNNQVENIYDELQKQKQANARTLILTTTKKTSEELTKYFQQRDEKIAYIHSDYNTFERNEILRKLRKGIYDTVVGINLLREGIDLPEVSLIIVLDADKESFFRNTRSLIQITGRAARNSKGRVIFYANEISKSMKATIDDNLAKRAIQKAYNEEHNITPQTIIKPITEPIEGQKTFSEVENFIKQNKLNKKETKDKENLIKELRQQMVNASKELNYERAAELRDIILELNDK